MKTTIKKMTALFSMICAMFFLSCSSDDEILKPEPQPQPKNELSGALEEDLTLNPDTDYILTGSFMVKEGAVLTIPAGTKIIAETGQNVYIAVEQGAKIQVMGTKSEPVVMTSENEAPGDWGGLLLIGEAETTAGIDAVAEVAGLVYGGTENEDSSGSISYLVIKGAGSQINADSQYNGLTLYSVGSGTSISNVALLNGADDGVEFFGGTVSVTNLYLENNEDDAVDWTEGWSGSITNTYVLHDIEGFSTAVEADGINKNPEINNFTAVSTTGGTALQFKKNSGAVITGLSLSGYDTSIDMVDQGAFSNVLIDESPANPEEDYNAEPSVAVSTFTWVK